VGRADGGAIRREPDAPPPRPATKGPKNELTPISPHSFEDPESIYGIMLAIKAP